MLCADLWFRVKEGHVEFDLNKLFNCSIQFSLLKKLCFYSINYGLSHTQINSKLGRGRNVSHIPAIRLWYWRMSSLAIPTLQDRKDGRYLVNYICLNVKSKCGSKTVE